MSYVMRHGRRIEVETTGAKAREQKRTLEPFIHVLVSDLVRGAKVLVSSGELVVWALILQRWHMTQPKPVASISNMAMAALGVGRKTKYRAIEKLRAAGLVKVRSADGKSLRVVPPDVCHGRPPGCAVDGHLPVPPTRHPPNPSYPYLRPLTSTTKRRTR
jgi:hypothetical protein